MTIRCYAGFEAQSPLREHEYDPGELGDWDVQVSVECCGLCHGDLRFLDNSWGISQYPMVPGHEVIGTVLAKGRSVTSVSEGQRVGVGMQVGACLQCDWCLSGRETCCPNLRLIGLGQPGGFAERMQVDSRFVYAIPSDLDSEAAAPLLCAGAAVYAPLKRHTDVTMRVGIIGMGGLGHLALQYAKALGCATTAFSLTPDKESYAKAFGADEFEVVENPERLQAHAGRYDFILSTVDDDVDWNGYVGALKPEGKLCLLGIPDTITVAALPIVLGRKSITSSLIANRHEMREMLEFSSRFGIRATSESLPMKEVNTAIERVRRNEQRFRIVLRN